MGPAHVFAAVHATLHLLPLHAICCLHAPAPMHAMLHVLAAVQSMVDAQEPAPVHVTTHGIPAGQRIGSEHVSAAVHVTWQVPVESQVPTPASAQIEGHAAIASIGSASRASFDAASAAASKSIELESASVAPSGSRAHAAASTETNVMSGNEHAAATKTLAEKRARSARERRRSCNARIHARSGPKAKVSLCTSERAIRNLRSTPYRRT